MTTGKDKTMGLAHDLVDQWWTCFEAGDLDAAMRLSTPDVDVMLPGGMHLCGPAEVSAALAIHREAFPDICHEVLTVVEQGKQIALELKVTGTHTGAFRTPTGDISATGRNVVWESVDVVTIRDGKIASWHSYYDQMAFLTQLGLLPEGATA